MIVQKDFLNKIKDFGLNSYEAKLWTALLSRGVSTAGELSDIAGVPRSRSYDVLESLEKKGFIIMKLGKPIKYVAVSPTEVVERVKKRVIVEAEKHTKIIESLKGSKVLEELNALHSKGIELVDPVEMTAFIKGRKNINNHFESMVRAANTSILILTSEEGVKRKGKILQQVLGKSKKKVSVRLLSPVTVTDPSLKKIAQVKKTSDLQSRFVIVDGKEALLMLVSDKTHPSFDTGIWINSEFLVKSMETLFDVYWKKK